MYSLKSVLYECGEDWYIYFPVYSNVTQAAEILRHLKSLRWWSHSRYLWNPTVQYHVHSNM